MGEAKLNVIYTKKCLINKAKIGYKFEKKEKFYKNFFNFRKSSVIPFLTCFYYSKNEHASNYCYMRKFGVQSGRYKWISDHSRPKIIWGPKFIF